MITGREVCSEVVALVPPYFFHPRAFIYSYRVVSGPRDNCSYSSRLRRLDCSIQLLSLPVVHTLPDVARLRPFSSSEWH